MAASRHDYAGNARPYKKLLAMQFETLFIDDFDLFSALKSHVCTGWVLSFADQRTRMT